MGKWAVCVCVRVCADTMRNTKQTGRDGWVKIKNYIGWRQGQLNVAQTGGDSQTGQRIGRKEKEALGQSN